MVSNTKQTFTMRARRKKNQGKRRKRTMRALTSGAAFPIQPPGYDPTAPDAKGPKPGT